MRISDWSSDVCSSDLPQPRADAQRRLARAPRPARRPHQRATARTVLGPLDRPQGRLRRAAPRLMETPMDTRDFTSGFTVDQAPDIVFAAICNVRGWWSADITGNADRVGDPFVHRVRDLHRCEIAIKQMVPGRSTVWTVLDKIGRASCRERVCQSVLISVVAGYFKKKTQKQH